MRTFIGTPSSIAVMSVLSLTLPAGAQTVSAATVLTLQGNAEQVETRYECEGEDELRTVRYINAAPNFLALVTIEDETLIMSAAISASGVRYVAGQFEWWTSGTEARLTDTTLGPDAEPLATCLEAVNTP